jgi:hypothetical protein
MAAAKLILDLMAQSPVVRLMLALPGQNCPAKGGDNNGAARPKILWN